MQIWKWYVRNKKAWEKGKEKCNKNLNKLNPNSPRCDAHLCFLKNSRTYQFMAVTKYCLLSFDVSCLLYWIWNSISQSLCMIIYSSSMNSPIYVIYLLQVLVKCIAISVNIWIFGFGLLYKVWGMKVTII